MRLLKINLCSVKLWCDPAQRSKQKKKEKKEEGKRGEREEGRGREGGGREGEREMKREGNKIYVNLYVSISGTN